MNNMIKYILKFEKEDIVKFVSHLDIIRVFDRAMRRAELPLGYSQGFNPHPLMTFAHPLGVGVASIGELMEMTLSEEIPTEVLIKGINSQLPQGFKVLEAKKIEGKNNFATLTYADYAIKAEGCIPDNMETALRSLKEILVDKKTKSGIKETDIKSFVKSFKQIEKGMFNVRLKTGAENLKPELLINGLEKYVDNFKTERVLILRTELLDNAENPLVNF